MRRYRVLVEPQYLAVEFFRERDGSVGDDNVDVLDADGGVGRIGHSAALLLNNTIKQQGSLNSCDGKDIRLSHHLHGRPSAHGATGPVNGELDFGNTANSCVAFYRCPPPPPPPPPTPPPPPPPPSPIQARKYCNASLSFTAKGNT